MTMGISPVGLQSGRYVESARRFVLASDRRIMRNANQWPAPRWVRVWMICAARGGDGWLWSGVGIGILYFGGVQRFDAVGAAALASAAGIPLFVQLKKIVRRERPCAFERHCWANPLPPDRFSFPSGHSLTAFAVAIALGWFYPALFLVLLFCAISVSASRILLGLHFLTDVLAGALAGTALAIGAAKFIGMVA